MNKIVNNLINSSKIDNNNYGYQHFSGIYKNGKPLYHGCNHLRNSYNGNCICFSTHAEIDVLHKVLKRCKLQLFKDIIDLSNYTIVVLRFGKNGNLRNSRPCNNCLDTMTKYRIKKILYSTDDGNFKIDKPEVMEKTHTSSGWKAYESGRLLN